MTSVVTAAYVSALDGVEAARARQLVGNPPSAADAASTAAYLNQLAGVTVDRARRLAGGGISAADDQANAAYINTLGVTARPSLASR